MDKTAVNATYLKSEYTRVLVYLGINNILLLCNIFICCIYFTKTVLQAGL